MKVWIVRDEDRVIDVFATEVLANEYVAQTSQHDTPRYVEIEEWEIQYTLGT